MGRSYAAGIVCLFLSFIFVVPITLSNVWAESKVISIKVDNLNVRKGPGLHYPVITKINKNETYQILERQSEWLKIKISEKESGWVFASYTSETDKQAERGISTVDFLRIRTGPGTENKAVGYLHIGTEVEILENSGEWVKIKTNDLTGWVYSSYLSRKQLDGSRESKNRLGTVIANSLNVRATPTVTAEVIEKLKYGERVHILDQSNDWYKVKSSNELVGWVSSTYISLDDKKKEKKTLSYVKILHHHTNIRVNPSLSSYIITKANRGETFRVLNKKGNWYEIELPNQRRGYIADWVVQTIGSVQNRGTIKNATIVVDPGHGGKDSGTIGKRGTVEKALTLQTALLLQKKLEKFGANVILTRNNDSFIPLNTRVSSVTEQDADMFISIHYDSSPDPRANGLTIYYYDAWRDNALAQSLNEQLSTLPSINSRGVRFGNFLVLRANTRPAVLLELGYLSNVSEEQLVSSRSYQERITNAICNSIVNYFETE